MEARINKTEISENDVALQMKDLISNIHFQRTVFKQKHCIQVAAKAQS